MAERIFRRWSTIAFVAVFSLASADLLASAQQDAPPAGESAVAAGANPIADGPRAGSPVDRSEGFRAVDGAMMEGVPGGMMMAAAYGLVWFMLLAYILRLSRLQARLEKEQQRLEGILAGANPAGPEAGTGSEV